MELFSTKNITELFFHPEELRNEALEDIAKTLVGEVRQRNWQIGGAESLTGGMVSSTLVSIPGVCELFRGCLVTYSNEIKTQLLGVSPELIEKHSAIHPKVALEMAAGAAKKLGTQLTWATTGLAGPTDWCGIKAGVFFVAIQSPEEKQVQGFYYNANRDAVRRAASLQTLTMAIRMINKN